MAVLVARANTFGTLCKYRLSFIPTLDEKYHQGLLSLELPHLDHQACLIIKELAAVIKFMEQINLQ